MDKFFVTLTAIVIASFAIMLPSFKQHSSAHTLEVAKVLLRNDMTIKAQRSPAIVYKRK